MSAFLQACLVTTPPTTLVRAEDLATWAAEALVPLLPPGHDPAQTGLFVATSDAGAAASIGLWAEALAQGPGFANPRDFPWTLASSPAGHIAARLQIRGPTYTLVGGGAATTAALGHALAALGEGQIATALVVALDLSPALHPEAGRTALAGLTLSAGSPEERWHLGAADGGGRSTPGTFAVPLLAALCEAHERGKAIAVGEPDEGWVALYPPTRRPS